MDKAREWLKSNHDEVLKLIMKWYSKMSGISMRLVIYQLGKWKVYVFTIMNMNLLMWIDTSMVYQTSELPLEQRLNQRLREMEEIPIFKLNKIVGTCIGKNKTKGTVSLLTTDGVVTVKFRPEYFAMFDKQMSERQADGTKKIVEKSWFNRGSMIMLTGMRRETNLYLRNMLRQLHINFIR